MAWPMGTTGAWASVCPISVPQLFSDRNQVLYRSRSTNAWPIFRAYRCRHRGGTYGDAPAATSVDAGIGAVLGELTIEAPYGSGADPENPDDHPFVGSKTVMARQMDNAARSHWEQRWDGILHLCSKGAIVSVFARAQESQRCDR